MKSPQWMMLFMDSTTVKISASIFVLVIVLGIFSWVLYGKNRELRDIVSNNAAVISGLIGEKENLGKKYNQATVILLAEKEKVNAIDENLRAETKRAKYLEKQVLFWKTKVSNSGMVEIIYRDRAVTEYTSNPVSEVESYKFNDFRLSADIDPEAKEFSYTLDQQFRLNTYKISDYDYRAELIEYNRLTSDVVATYELDSFNILRVHKNPDKWNFGFNMTIGFGGDLDTKLEVTPNGYVGFNFISFGTTHLDSKFRILSVNVGTNSSKIVPFSYNLGRSLPIFRDLYIEPAIGIQYDKRFVFGIGLSTTL